MTKTISSHPISSAVPWLTWEVLLFGILLAIAAITRFLFLGERAMSHDESLHTYHAWKYYQGLGYEHNPMMHGPFQFHILAVVYYLFGATDFTSRIPVALFSIATLWMVWYWKRYIGKWGALFAGLMLIFSPYMLFYGRYTRNEAFVGFFAILMLYAVLRYFETGFQRYLYILVLTIILHLITKETSYIYIGEVLIFLAGYLFIRVTKQNWQNEKAYRGFIFSVAGGILLSSGLIILALSGLAQTQSSLPEQATKLSPLFEILMISTIVAWGLSIYFLLTGYGIKGIRAERSFDMLILISTLVLPTLSAPVIKSFGGNPLDYSSAGLSSSLRFIVPLLIISIVVGLWWNRKVWAISAAIFWLIFVAFYTSMFSHGTGFFSGLIGSLGYWLEQHPVERGSQPLYYYLLIQIPVYELLPAVGAVLAYYFGFRKKTSKTGDAPSPSQDMQETNYGNTFGLLGYWTIASLIAFTIAGERMPWLTYHIALPMILLGGWGIGQLVERIDWEGLKERHAGIAIVSMVVFLLSSAAILFILLGATPPLRGNDLDNLQSTSLFLVLIASFGASAATLWYLLKTWPKPNTLRLGTFTFTAILFIFTITSSIRAIFITYGDGSEYLVYAHGSSGIKNMLKQIEVISFQTTGSPRNIAIAHDDDSAWPLTWYLRDYPNVHFFGAQPAEDLINYPVIIVGDNNYQAIEPFVRNTYYQQDFIRMVWPNMDYFNLNAARIKQALLDKGIRSGILNIWLFRNYEDYAAALGTPSEDFNSSIYSSSGWDPADRMRLYIRKDIATQLWDYGSSPVAEIPPDPYEGSQIDLPANLVVGSFGVEAGQLDSPRGLAVAPDGSVFVADSRNHRIQHFSPDGVYINSWGGFADINQGEAPPGMFNEPWGVAVARDGSVFVSDTWNHRIQKFSADGKPIKVWGIFGQDAEVNGFYGPRGLDLDAAGNLYVADTGNSRIVVYDKDGNYLAEFGDPGVEVGQFSEPVDVHIGDDGLIYVTDTWNQRVQVFEPTEDFTEFQPITSWSVAGWFGGSNENKPYIAVARDGAVFITDPEGNRVIEFEGASGQFVRTWGSYGTESNQINIPIGIAVDSRGNIWVSDSANHRVLQFKIPNE